MSSLSYFGPTHDLSQTRIQSVLYMMIRRLMLLVIALFDNLNRLFLYALPQIFRQMYRLYQYTVMFLPRFLLTYLLVIIRFVLFRVLRQTVNVVLKLPSRWKQSANLTYHINIDLHRLELLNIQNIINACHLLREVNCSSRRCVLHKSLP